MKKRKRGFIINDDVKIYKGNFAFTKTKDEFTIIPSGYIIVKGSKIDEIVTSYPEEYKNIPIIDFGDHLVIPGFVDLHLHAAQYHNRGLCLDDPLIDWLFKCTFPEENKFKDLIYAKSVYEKFISRLWRSGTTRSLVYNTIHKESTKLLINMFIKSGLGAYIGKVNMDINAPEYLRENTLQSLKDTEEIIMEYNHKSDLVKPIIAPRFVPACSSELMLGLGYLAQIYDVPIMSHLSEETYEIELVKGMHPFNPTYASIYNQFGLFGQKPTVMAHAVFSNEQERALIKHNNVFIAHCPTSNCSLGSGMMPVRKFLNENINLGLGSDIAGGGIACLLQVMSYALAVSKIVWLFSNKTLPALTTSEVFYLSTKGGGKFFGKVGSFEPNYEFDALIIEDVDLAGVEYTLEERVNRLIHLGNETNIVEMYVSGKKIEKPNFD
ncbi:MAG: guaD1 [Haloplasmataceae bacterium]|jgi:guanine deaminase|nr:guaD1 [Haloplasmataceae bacterium]